MGNISRTRIILAAVLLVTLGVIGTLVVFKNLVGDIRPALLPSAGDLPEIIEKQEARDPVEFPLKIASGFKIGVFAKDLDKPRDLQFSPDGTLLVSLPSAGKVVALPDKDGDGRADLVKDVLTDLNRPHGFAFHLFDNAAGKQTYLFVAEETGVVRYNWNEETLTAEKDKSLFTIPAGGRHFTRSLAVKDDGTLFVSIGSTCDVCFEKSEFLGAVVVSDVDGKQPSLFAKGLRNSVFIALNPATGELWGTEMGRDFLGDNLPPDEVNIIREGKDYGWPRCYGDKTHDEKFDHDHIVGECKDTIAPVYKTAAHSSPLGLTFIGSKQFPKSWQGDLLVAYHGSWNRSIPSGYKVVRLKIDANKVTGEEDFIAGFLQGSTALGRPVDLEFDSAGSLYISDDKAGAIYKVSRK